MLENQSTEITASDKTAAHDQKPDDYLSIQSKAREERNKAQTASNTDPNQPAEAAPAATESVLSKLMKELEGVSLDDLPEGEISALAEKLRSKSLSRFGELTKKAKTAEAQLAELLAEREKGFAPQAVKPENNPFASVDTVEALNQEYQNASGHIEWAEALLEDREGSHPEEIVYTDGTGKEYTKAAIKQSLRDARKARDVYIGEQYKEIKTKEQRKVQRALVAEKAANELPWLKGDDNDTRRQYESLKDSVKLDAIEQADPEFAVHLDRILAHAANSMFSAQKASATAKPPAALNPTSSPSFSGAAAQRANPNADRILQEAEANLAKTQTPEAYLAFQRARRAALAKR